MKFYFKLMVHKQSRTNDPIVNKAVAVDTVGVGDLELVDLIRNEILLSKPSLEYADDDIKEVAVVNGSSTTDLRVLLYSEIEAWKSFLHGVNNHLILMVIIDTLMAPKKVVSSLFHRRMIATQPILTNMTSAFTTAKVVVFLEGLSAAPTRDRFLKFYPEEKPSVQQQIESFVIHTLTINNLGFKNRTDMDEKNVVEKAVSRTVQVFVEVQKYRSILSVRQKSLFRSPLLDLITHCQPIKERLEKTPPLNVVKIVNFIKNISNVIQQYPSWYNKINPKTKLVKGYGIIMELNNVRLVWNNHLNYLREQNERNIFANDDSSRTITTAKDTQLKLINKQP